MMVMITVRDLYSAALSVPQCWTAIKYAKYNRNYTENMMMMILILLLLLQCNSGLPCTHATCMFVRQIATIENEIAQTMLDTEQARSQINSLEKKKAELASEMNAKDDIVAKSQSEIKRRNVEIKRKQDQLQQLSSELDKLITMAGGTELGPLEIQINSLQKSIDSENSTIAELQHAWLRDQSELVSRPASVANGFRFSYNNNNNIQISRAP